MDKIYTITKKVAKHGRQAVLVIPKLLEQDLGPGTVVRVTFEVIELGGGE
jgi:hypothetical protein